MYCIRHQIATGTEARITILRYNDKNKLLNMEYMKYELVGAQPNWRARDCVLRIAFDVNRKFQQYWEVAVVAGGT